MKLNLSLLLVLILVYILALVPDPPKEYFGMESGRCEEDHGKLVNCTLYEGKDVTDLMNEWKGLYDDKDCDDQD